MLVLAILLSISFLLNISLTSALVEITKEEISKVVISELDEPAVFNFEIKNLGPSDNFEIYSLVGVDMTPEGMFLIEKDKTKEIEVKVYPDKNVKKNFGTVVFVYKIRGEKAGIQNDTLAIEIYSLDKTIEANCYNFGPDADSIVVYVTNKVDFKFDNIKAKFSSAFFDFEKEFSLSPYEKKEFEIALDKDKIKGFAAGPYLLRTDIQVGDVESKLEETFRFTEKQGVTTRKTQSGFIISTTTIEKINDGNIPMMVQIKIDRNIISRLFTTFNIEPDEVEREGMIVHYTWREEVGPIESIAVKASTNWLYPFILFVAIVITAWLTSVYVTTHIILRKRISFVKTKGGEFALKVSLRVRARKYVEKVSVNDKLPPLTKLFKRFGAIEPDKIDEKNRRLEWNIESLQPGEERVFSYIIYSKIAVIGKYELPAATAVFERDGTVHETNSNKVVVVAEVGKRKR